MIYLIRHGQTEFNLQARLQGRRDSPLTELGVEQARRMGRQLKRFIGEPEAVVVISSPLGRAVRTAELVCEAAGLDLQIQLEPRLAEIHVGEWEGLDRQEIEALAPGVIDGARGWLMSAPGGERYAEIAGRIRAWLSEIDEEDGRRRIVVSHGVTGRLLRHIYAGGAPQDTWTGKAPPQDAVFRLWRGEVLRVDAGSEESPRTGA